MNAAWLRIEPLLAPVAGHGADAEAARLARLAAREAFIAACNEARGGAGGMSVAWLRAEALLPPVAVGGTDAEFARLARIAAREAFIAACNANRDAADDMDAALTLIEALLPTSMAAEPVAGSVATQLPGIVAREAFIAAGNAARVGAGGGMNAAWLRIEPLLAPVAGHDSDAEAARLARLAAREAFFGAAGAASRSSADDSDALEAAWARIAPMLQQRASACAQRASARPSGSILQAAAAAAAAAGGEDDSSDDETTRLARRQHFAAFATSASRSFKRRHGTSAERVKPSGLT